MCINGLHAVTCSNGMKWGQFCGTPSPGLLVSLHGRQTGVPLHHFHIYKPAASDEPEICLPLWWTKRTWETVSPLGVPGRLGQQWLWDIQDPPDITQQPDTHAECCSKDSLSPNLRCSLMPGIVGQIWPNTCFCMAQELRMALTSLSGKCKSKEEYIKMWKTYEIHILVSNKFHSYH